MTNDSDIDIDDEELVELQKREFIKNISSNRMIPKQINVNKSNYYNDVCLHNIDNYKKFGMELNAALRGVQTYKSPSELHKMILNFDKCFKKVETIFPNESGNYIKTYRSMSKKYDVNKNQGYMSTSAPNPIEMSSRHLMTIFIPKDAEIIISDISKLVGKKTFEIILPRGTNLIHLNTLDHYIVQTPLSIAYFNDFKNLLR